MATADYLVGWLSDAEISLFDEFDKRQGLNWPSLLVAGLHTGIVRSTVRQGVDSGVFTLDSQERA
jgi:hypothetical protein